MTGVDPYRGVCGRHSTRAAVGNLLRDDVATVWNSRPAQRHRNKSLAHPGCRSCEEFAACQGACPLYWRRIGFGELCDARGFDPVDMEHFRS